MDPAAKSSGVPFSQAKEDESGLCQKTNCVVGLITGPNGISGTAGKDAASFAHDAYTPYVFIMEADGKLIVHPTLAGKDLKVEGKPIYDAIEAATPQGSWVKYMWKDNEKNTYIKKTSNKLIVGSGY